MPYEMFWLCIDAAKYLNALDTLQTLATGFSKSFFVETQKKKDLLCETQISPV